MVKISFYGVTPDTTDAGIEADMLATAPEEGQMPEDFALWFGRKYDLAIEPGASCYHVIENTK